VANQLATAAHTPAVLVGCRIGLRQTRDRTDQGVLAGPVGGVAAQGAV